MMRGVGSTFNYNAAAVAITGGTISGVSVAGSTATMTGAVQGLTVKATQAFGYISSDASPGISTTIDTAGLVGKTITVKDGLITGFA